MRYAAAFEKKWWAYKKPVDGSWRVDELFVRVKSGWKYLYRCGSAWLYRGLLLQCYSRDPGSKGILPQSSVRENQDPHSITLDGQVPSHRAVARLEMCGDLSRFGLRVRCS